MPIDLTTTPALDILCKQVELDKLLNFFIKKIILSYLQQWQHRQQHKQMRQRKMRLPRTAPTMIGVQLTISGM